MLGKKFFPSKLWINYSATFTYFLRHFLCTFVVRHQTWIEIDIDTRYSDIQPVLDRSLGNIHLNAYTVRLTLE